MASSSSATSEAINIGDTDNTAPPPPPALGRPSTMLYSAAIIRLSHKPVKQQPTANNETDAKLERIRKKREEN